MPIIYAEPLRKLSARIFEAAGTPAATAERVATSLVEANLAGHDSHGVIRLLQYVADVRAGKICPDAQPEIVRETQTTALVDGHWGFGQVVARWAMERAIEKAVTEHLAAVAIYHCNHIGRAGEYALLAAERGMVGFVTCNATRRVVPYGGLQPRLGTNPIAWAVPGDSGSPFLLDYATSIAAEGKLRVARSRGVPVPPGWILDRDGQPTTDPNVYYEGGMLLPVGEYKGYALALLADLLGGVLTGAGCSSLGSYERGNGVFLMALDVAAFRPLVDFTAEAEALYATMRATPPAPNGEGVMVPGEPETKSRAERTRRGIEIDENTWRALQALATELGVAVDPDVTSPDLRH